MGMLKTVTMVTISVSVVMLMLIFDDNVYDD